MRVYVDAGVILCFITGDPPEMAEKARSMFEAADRRELVLALDAIILAEVVWVLQSFYKIDKRKIVQVLQAFIANDGVEMPDKSEGLYALALFAEKNVDFADALVSVHMNRDGVTGIFSFDKHFDRLPGITCLLPGRIPSTN